MINICPLPLFDHIYELKCYNLVQERRGRNKKLTLTLSLSLTYARVIITILTYTNFKEVNKVCNNQCYKKYNAESLADAWWMHYKIIVG